MASNLRTQAGPWCGGLTDTSVQAAMDARIKAHRRREAYFPLFIPE